MRGAECEVIVDRAWICIEVVAAVELQRVDEDADHHDIGMAASLIDQCQVTRVQRPHGGDQCDPSPSEAVSIAPRAECRRYVEQRDSRHRGRQ